MTRKIPILVKEKEKIVSQAGVKISNLCSNLNTTLPKKIWQQEDLLFEGEGEGAA